MWNLWKQSISFLKKKHPKLMPIHNFDWWRILKCCYILQNNHCAVSQAVCSLISLQRSNLVITENIEITQLSDANLLEKNSDITPNPNLSRHSAWVMADGSWLRSMEGCKTEKCFDENVWHRERLAKSQWHWQRDICSFIADNQLLLNKLATI